MKKKLLIFTMLFGVCFASNIDIKNAFVKVTPPNIKQTAIFMDIYNNTDKDVKIIDANTTLGGVTELHTHIHDGNKMKMVKIKDIDIPKNSKVQLKPGGLHIMVFEISKPVKPKEKVTVNLKLDDNSIITKEVIAKEPHVKHEDRHKDKKMDCTCHEKKANDMEKEPHVKHEGGHN